MWLAYQTIWLREIVGRLVPMRFVEYLVPKYGMVLVVDDSGNITNTLQDPSGSISMISEAQRHPITGSLWLGSHSNRFVGIVGNSKYPRQLLF